jgi:hypothetical protein
MVFIKEVTWLRPFGWSIPFTKGQELPREAKDLTAQPFDAADAMERGLVGVHSTPEEDRLLLPPSQERQLNVRVSSKGLEHKLLDESGELMLTSRARLNDGRIDIFLASKGTDGAASFTLVFDNDKSDFKLRWESQDFLNSPSQELVHIVLSSEEIGRGAYMYLDVTIHEVGTGSTLKLGSKRPVWNKKLGSLTLDFNGRCDQASPRNIQLCPVDDAADGSSAGSVMLFGKTGSGTFILDSASPLGAVQAFAVALATSFWD